MAEETAGAFAVAGRNTWCSSERVCCVLLLSVTVSVTV